MQLNQDSNIFEVTHPKLLKLEWKINGSKLDGEYSIEFNFVTPILLQNPSGNPMGKIFGDKTFTLKRKIDISTQYSIIRTKWSFTLRTFPVVGETDIIGFETIDWVWKRTGANSQLILEDTKTGEKLAEFNRKRLSLKYIGDIIIFPNFPDDINWLVIFSACYSLKHIKNEEKSI